MKPAGDAKTIRYRAASLLSSSGGWTPPAARAAARVARLPPTQERNMGKTPRKSGGTPRRTIPKGKGSTPRRSSSPKGDGLDPIALSAGDGARAQTAPEQDSWRRAGTAVKVGVALAGSAGLAPQVRGDPNKIKVGIRCRPLSSTEKDMEQQVITQFSGTSNCPVS